MVSLKSHSGIYTLKTVQELPIDLKTAWAFFSSPNNLEKITPKHMGFKITSGEAGSMYAGQIITYKVSPFPGIKSSWVTEITHVDHLNSFVDEQRFGPYAMWHHEHIFETSLNGVRMIDKVSYKLPFGILGRMVHPFLVKGKLMKIFTHRYKVLEKMFPTKQ
ncbi:SRPBCC family protein [Roseivirga sp.]|uniref:SRPBCC family protein n=1 Tax=Roseivirga sp. TaxID=1964215 RepID=UPI002B26D174|nr:SRPBCC family protein [Roseivirga sp.]